MRGSLLVSLIIHFCIVISLFFVLRVVPRMRLPQKIYSVKILQPVLRRSEPPKAEAKVEEKKPEVKKPAPAKPKEKPKKKEEKKTEPKPEEKPLDVSVDKDEGDKTSLVVDGPRFPFSYYLSAVERKVSQNWFSSVSTGEEGLRCIVFFQLRRNGTVSDVRVEEGSGNSYFDRSALRAIRSASPFPPLPKAFTESFLGIHFTFLQKD